MPEKVFVYFNLHKKLWSVKDTKTGKVCEHVDVIHLRDVTFKVSEAGRQRVLSEKRKNVHAGVEGYLCQLDDGGDYEQVTYNPYKYEKFVRRGNLEAVDTADSVKMISGEGKVPPQVAALNPA